MKSRKQENFFAPKFRFVLLVKLESRPYLFTNSSKKTPLNDFIIILINFQLITMDNDFELQELMDDEMPQASAILNQLITAWVNEKNAPELLQVNTTVLVFIIFVKKKDLGTYLSCT